LKVERVDLNALNLESRSEGRGRKLDTNALSRSVSGRFAGEVAEWSIAAVLKTAGPQGPGGSNPSLSAILFPGNGKRRRS
jgi:hypothetical protein